jgi:hypothetical protein
MSILILIVAYLLAGAIYVAADLKEHVVSQPAYAREYTQRGKILPLVLAVFTWLPATLLRRRLMPLLVFVLLAILGIYFSSI